MIYKWSLLRRYNKRKYRLLRYQDILHNFGWLVGEIIVIDRKHYQCYRRRDFHMEHVGPPLENLNDAKGYLLAVVRMTS